MVDIDNPANTTSSTNSTSTSTNRLITPPTVIAPGLTAAGVETCLGSASAGLAVMGGGFTFGSTKVDEGCTIRLLARQLFAFGFQKAALALMCQDEHVAMAMQSAGSPCPDPPADNKQSDRTSPALSFNQEDQPIPLLQEAQTESVTQEPQTKPFTAEEAALFSRQSNMN